MLRDKIIKSLESFGVEYNCGLEDIFYMHAPVAQVAISKLPDSKKILDFLEDFYSFLENESGPIKDPEKLIDFVQLSYIIYHSFREEFPEAHITPNTTFRQLGIKQDECECNLFVQVFVKDNGFEDGLTADEYLKMLQHDVKYTILQFAKFNELFLKR